MGEGLASPQGEGQGGRRKGHQGGRGQSRRGREQEGIPGVDELNNKIQNIFSTFVFILRLFK